MHAVSLSVNVIISCHVLALSPPTKCCLQDVTRVRVFLAIISAGCVLYNKCVFICPVSIKT